MKYIFKNLYIENLYYRSIYANIHLTYVSIIILLILVVDKNQSFILVIIYQLNNNKS